MPDGSELNIYTKFSAVDDACGDESAEFVLYDCEDDMCDVCSDVAEVGETTKIFFALLWNLGLSSCFCTGYVVYANQRLTVVRSLSVICT